MKSDGELLDLVRLRVSQIHRCPVGQPFYTSKLRQGGIAPLRLTELPGWPVSLHYTAAERAALALAEILARPLSFQSGLLSETLRQADLHFTRSGLLRVIVAIEALQDWKEEEAP